MHEEHRYLRCFSSARTRAVNAVAPVFGDNAEHGPRRTSAPEPARFAFIGVHSWSLNGRRDRFFQKSFTFLKDFRFSPVKGQARTGPCDQQHAKGKL